MTKQSTYNTWLLTNLLGSISIVLIIFILNLLFNQIAFDTRRIIQVALGIIIFFIFGIVLTLPHLLFVQLLIRKEYKLKVLWNKIWKSMILPYGILIFIVVLVNWKIYKNPVYELPNIILFGILILHFSIGIYLWRRNLINLNNRSLQEEKNDNQN